MAAALAASLIFSVGCSSAAKASQTQFDAAVQRTKSVMLTDPRGAAIAARRAEQLSRGLLNRQARAVASITAMWLEGEARYRMDDVAAAAPLILRARDQVSRITPGSKLEADILLTSGSIHGSRTEVAKALRDFQQAHRIMVKIKDARGQAMSLVCISTLYKDAKDYDSALMYLAQALDVYTADPRMSISIHNNMGVILQHVNRIADAELEFSAAARLARNLDSPVVQLPLLRNRVRNSLLAGRLATADKWITDALRLSRRAGGQDGQLTALMAQAALRHGHPDDAQRLIANAFAGVDLDTTTVPFREAHQIAFETFQALHRPDQALPHLIALKRLDDDATKLATETSTALMAARFNSANQEARIARMKDAERLRVARDALRQAELQRALLLVATGAAAVILLLLLHNLRVLRRSRDQVSEMNDDLNLTNAALEKALAAKTEFLASTSHEIRTPLNGILGMTQVMLADPTLKASTRDRLTVVQGAGHAMRGLVDDILDVAKMEKGKLLLDQRPFDLAACLRDASAMWAGQARSKGVAFLVDVDACPPLVAGDAGRVRQIVVNLLSNALKFTAAGTVAMRAEQAGEGVRISVSDTGIGIAPERQGDVFEPFRQADASTTRRFGGTGLGLSICRSLARAMGGDIALASEPGRGSTFTVALPLPVAAAVPEEVDAGDRGPVLLVVERNPIARAMFRSLFAAHVGTMRFAATPEEVAVGVAKGDVTQLLVDDATVRAGGNPHAVLGAIVAAAGPAPVNLLWPVAAAGERDALLALGITTVIAKPVSSATLIGTLFSRERDEATDRGLVSQAA